MIYSGRIPKIITGFISLSLVVTLGGFLFTPSRVGAQDALRELIRKRQEVEQQKKEAARQLQARQNEQKALEQRKQTIDRNITVTSVKISELEGQINTLSQEIDQKTVEIDLKIQEIELLTNDRNQTIRSLYKIGSPGTWAVVLTSSSISEVIGRSTYHEALERQITANLRETGALKAELEQQKAQLESKKREVAVAQVSAERHKQSLESDKKEKEQLLVTNSKVQQDIKTKIAEAEKYSNDLSIEIVRVANDLRERGFKKGGGIPKGNSPIGLVLPMPYNYISRGFGPLGERDVFGMTFHTGMDLVAPCGTPIIAAADGVVTFAAYAIGYGNNVRVAHNETYSTLYAHFSTFAVSNGQQVKQNDIIGLSGTTGWSTGCHLHFEIRRNGFPEDPELYLGF